MGEHCLVQEIENLPFLQAERFDYSENPLDKTTTGFTMATKSIFAPQHTGTQYAFDMIVRWFDARLGYEGPQGRLHRQEVLAQSRSLGVGASAPLPQLLVEDFLAVGNLFSKLPPAQAAAAKAVPQVKYHTHNRQTQRTDFFG